ncbi:TetR family transcriptional regulator [Amycolatopsis acidiphila]|uniref:TetR family transcriptional regulator n=1 Tax=Amycolatopsis acidiphila TaxID=715473 RepID=A0A558ALD7_9PSEU|nr:TetR family transcriptional regulator [Amycolatopsis acidiphila]TVT25075.1 TetR family transcriptional regulator [Amycolatopsis acidiphila]UIJ57413.1 TetR family transcriptional regulator [Amycolatopsis acidiphila]GHG84364.1 TetR family transcriptional regulator [Amycolatopsis acidiphila]
MTTNGTTGRRRGPNDPERRIRIARAAIQVVAERGIDGLTHRAVAAAAGVPLGSTTYHFATLDDLLEVALHEAAANNVRVLREWEENLPPDTDFAAALSELVMSYLHEQYPQTVVEYDLYVAALRRPRLRAATAAWDAALTQLFGSRTDALTGRLLAGLFCGLVLQAVLADPRPSAAQVEALVRRAIAGPGA